MKHVAFMLLVVLASARGAAADPVVSRVLTAPTAWLPAAGSAVGTTGVDTHGDSSVIVGYGFGGIAEVEVGMDGDVRGCADCTLVPHSMTLGRAAFRLGAHQDAWFAGMPALVFGVRTTFAARGHEFGGARVGEAYLVASRELGPVRIHTGIVAMDASYGPAQRVRMGTQVKPFAGLEFTPPQYPKSQLLLDVMYLPRFEVATPRPEWIAGFGARYQALPWGSIELAVRVHEDFLDGIAAMVRVNGVWSGRSAN